jgi:thioredoxin-like negative regulator of GroEL
MVLMGPGRSGTCLAGALAIGVAVALVAVIVDVVRERRLDAEWARARSELESGRYDLAQGRLVRLAASRPDDGAVAYALGVCERALGHHDEAIAAWSRVPPQARVDAVRAAVAAARTLIELGRYADAEWTLDALDRGAPRDLPETALVHELLAFLSRFEGRTDEIRPPLERAWQLARPHSGEPGWSAVSSPLDLLRQYATVDLEPIASDEVRATLEEARRKAPEDDRVWLGLANLATREGRLDDADRLLRACAERRPRDAAVARARLDWAMAAGHVEAARAALKGLPADALAPDRVLDLMAWFAARRHDASGERAALERLLTLDPCRAGALERLAELALAAGDPAEAGSLRERKAELDGIRRLYRISYFRPKLPDEAPQLAQWAEGLGRTFEARVWWLLLAESRPGDLEVKANLRRLEDAARPPIAPSVADLRAALDEAAVAASPGPSEQSNADWVPPRFRDDAEAVGLRFRYDNGASAERQLPETMGGGVAVLDYDADGWLDVYCTQGSPLRDTSVGGDRLYRNRGDGTFEDATETAGLGGRRGFGNGVAVGDFDNDGHPDLFVTRLRSYGLYRNRGDGTFEDLTETAGLGGERDWPTSAAFADIDGDGDLDLYVCHYAAWDVERPKPCRHADGSPAYCPPHMLKPAQDRLFRNDGGRFVDITAEAGISGESGRGLGVLAADLDGDGRVDFFVANDGTANALYRNVGGGRFEDIALGAGVAANAGGGFQAGMGVARGDLDGDGLLDLLVTNFYGESTTWFRGLGQGMFADHTVPSGLAALSRHLLGFGITLIDANDDGYPDVLTVNGHVDDFRPTFPYAMPAQLLVGTGEGRLADASGRAGDAFRVLRLGRGLAVGDLDRDGRIDAVAIDQAGPLVYFHNVTEGGGHALRIVLEGTASNRDAVGAVVTVHAGGRRFVAARCGGGSYQSASEPVIHVGLGRAERVEALEVAWPSGRSERFEGLTVDAEYRIREGDARAVFIHRFVRRAPSP